VNFYLWLEYSESNNCVYYLSCFVCRRNIKKRGGFDAFTAQGFNSWKKVHDTKNCAVLVHIGSDHNNSVQECQALLNNPNHIGNIMEEVSNLNTERNCLRLRTSIAVVKWLSLQFCSFRGHDEKYDSKNRENIVELIKLLAEFNPKITSVVPENPPQYAKYTSPDIQKEILSILALKIRKHIREEISDAKLSILVDEICDISK
jgi:hypothetical protein